MAKPGSEESLRDAAAASSESYLREPLSAGSSSENPEYLSEQLITYLGNKRSLLPFITTAFDTVCNRIGSDRLDTLDLFAGSGVVSRLLKSRSRKLISNDIERYAEVIGECYLANRSEIDFYELRGTYDRILQGLEEHHLRTGIIAKSYAPRNESAIAKGERVFYTPRNARYLDTARLLIEELPGHLQSYFLGPLLSQASVHANTAGVFKGFYKNRADGIGKYGGSGGDALSRILRDITLPFPIFSEHECEVSVHRRSANDLVGDLPPVDLAYLDPPYNQHPYGSNYFMLNLLVDYVEPESVSNVSGIPSDWTRSDYNKSHRAFDAFADLVERLDAKFVVVSFNSEGFCERDALAKLLSRFGRVDLFETGYNTFRGSRNLRNRNIHVTEYLFLLEKR